MQCKWPKTYLDLEFTSLCLVAQLFMRWAAGHPCLNLPDWSVRTGPWKLERPASLRALVPFSAAPFKFSLCSRCSNVFWQKALSADRKERAAAGCICWWPRGRMQRALHSREMQGVQKRWVSLCKAWRNRSTQLPIEVEERGLKRGHIPRLKSQRNLLTWQRCSIYSRILGISGLRGGRSFSLPMSCLNAPGLHKTAPRKVPHFLTCFRSFSSVTYAILVSQQWHNVSRRLTHRILDHKTHSVQPRYTPSSRGSVSTPWEEMLTCAVWNFLPAAVHICHQWGWGLHTGAIPQDIASSWAEISVQRGNDLSASSAEKKKIIFCFPATGQQSPIVSFCQPAALRFVFIHNRLPDSLFRKKREAYTVLFRDVISKYDQATLNSLRSARQIHRLRVHFSPPTKSSKSLGAARVRQNKLCFCWEYDMNHTNSL